MIRSAKPISLIIRGQRSMHPKTLIGWITKKNKKKSENLVKTEKDSCVTLKEFFCPFCDLIGL